MAKETIIALLTEITTKDLNNGNRQTSGYNRSNNYSESGNRNYNNDRPYNKPYNNNRPYNNDRPRYNRDENSVDRSFNNNDRPYRPVNRPAYGNNSNNGNRPYNSRNTGSYNNRSGNRPYNNRPQRRDDNYPQQRKRIIYEEINIDPNEPIRLNKYMANAGVCSRREADEFIQQGLVKVNGVVMSELGTKITRNDVVMFQDKVVTLEHKIYVLLNKPKDCVTTSDDPQGRLTVMDIVRNACTERIYPVGRLDRNTTGVCY